MVTMGSEIIIMGHRIQGFNPFTWFALIKIKIESVDMSVFCKIVKHAVL